ncbi:hypothetical protein [Actinomadura atramentaria]|uniref:hypothetical protein n=1 Tax=Actinomadura atramentaria TaxID=1990 RepID=UPI00035C62D6|nr:hypothetical protein [Actinomadura atramentaria]
MPQQRRFRRLGSATAVSAGAAALVFLGAPAASAQAAAPRECAKGTDPASTLENWKCQWDNWTDGLKPKPSPTPTPKPSKPTTKPKPPAAKPKPKPTKDRPAAPPRTTVSVPGGAAGAGGGVTELSRPGAQPYSPGAPSAGSLALPTPQVAGAPGAAATTANQTAAPQMRLVSPVAAAEPQRRGMLLWVAAAAAAAGAAAALQISVVSRGFARRSHGRTRSWSRR